MTTNEIKEAIVRVVNENVPCGREFQDLRLTVQSAANRHFHCPEFSKALFLAIESGEVVAKGGKLWPGEPVRNPDELAGALLAAQVNERTMTAQATMLLARVHELEAEKKSITVNGWWKACTNGWEYWVGDYCIGGVTFKGINSYMTGLDLSGDLRFHPTLEAAADFIEEQAQIDFQGYFKNSGLTVTLTPGSRPERELTRPEGE